MDPVWEKLHSSREWGKYPAEDLVRTVMRSFGSIDRSKLEVLEIGCGAGANLGFFLNEGFKVAGIDGSPSAIESAGKRLAAYSEKPDLRVGNFVELPWESNSFDIVVDYFALYANRMDDIRKTLSEIQRVLRSGGKYYSRSWGKGTQGYNKGRELEPGTLENPESGPCRDMGVSHFFGYEELLQLYGDFSQVDVRKVVTENVDAGDRVVEWCIWAQQ